MLVREAAQASPPDDDVIESNCAGMAHLSASIDVAATMATRNADDLEKAVGALGMCLETLEYMMVLSTSISNVLGEVAASELARADLEHHFEQIVRIIGAFAQLTGNVARDIANDATMPAQAQGWAENVNRLLERARQTTDEIPPVLEQVGDQVRQVASGLDRSREVAERSVWKAKSAYTFITSLREQFERNSRHMRELATSLGPQLLAGGGQVRDAGEHAHRGSARLGVRPCRPRRLRQHHHGRSRAGGDVGHRHVRRQLRDARRRAASICSRRCCRGWRTISPRRPDAGCPSGWRRSPTRRRWSWPIWPWTRTSRSPARCW